MALIRAKAEGPRMLGVDPKTGMNVYAINGRFGAYVQLGEMPEKGSEGKAEALVADRQHDRIDGHARGGAASCSSCRASSASHPEIGDSRSSPASAASVPTSSTATTTGRSRQTDDLFTVDLERALALLAAPKRSARQAAKRVIRQDRGARRRHGAAGARRPVRSVRHRRRDQRVDPEGRRSGDDLARGRAGAARSAPRRAAARAAARPPRRGGAARAAAAAARRSRPTSRRPSRAAAKVEGQGQDQAANAKAAAGKRAVRKRAS